MKVLHLSLRGIVNSFRLPDYHTYHKTLPLPPKTTVAGLIGAVLGIEPEVVNSEWLAEDRFSVAIYGHHKALFKDLWQYRKYTQRSIRNFNKGIEDLPWFTSITTRELLFGLSCDLYLNCKKSEDIDLLLEAFKNPAWALSLGREDELVHLKDVEVLEAKQTKGNILWQHTILPFDIFERGAELDENVLREKVAVNLLAYAPSVIKIPDLFEYKNGTRVPSRFQTYSFIGDLPIRLSKPIEYYQVKIPTNGSQALFFI